MGRGRRYEEEAHLNLKKVFAVILVFIAIIAGILMLKHILTNAKDSKPIEIINYYALYENNKWGILGTDGNIVIEPMYQEMPILIDNSKDVFLCTYNINEEDGSYKTKVVNSKNEEILTGYEKVEALENYDKDGNLWYEKNVLKIQKNGKWGLINLNGAEISEIIYDDIKTIKGIENSIIVQKDGKYGLLNDKGTTILKPEYAQIINFGDDYQNGYITVNQDNKYGIISSSGDIILENNYEKIENIYSEKYYVIEEGGKQQLIDKTQKVLTENFDKIKQIGNSGVVFEKNNKFGYMLFDGTVKIEANYEDLKEVTADILVAKKDGKQGVIDLDQNEKIAFSYKNISYNSKAGIYVADDENYKSTLLNNNFEVKLFGIVSEINTKDGYLKVKVEDDYKYYNFKFEEKKSSEIFTNNKLFLSKKDGKYGFVDSKDNVVVDYIYDDATELNKYGYAAVKKDGLWGSINSEGKVIIEPHYNLNENLKINFIGKWHLGLDLNMNYYCDK